MRVLVTGGGGFLGRHIVAQLLERGDEVTSLTRSAQPELEALGATALQGDICSPDDCARACQGQNALIHTAALVGPWLDPEAAERVNVGGTQNLLQAARHAHIPRFVFTSSPSAIFDGTPLVDAPPSVPYPPRFPNVYAQTKARSEQLVLAAHRDDGLGTTALRPQLMWGPGDPHVLPLLQRKARAGLLRVIGDGRARVDLTYIDNAARAHLDALDALGRPPGPHHPGGRAYFISNDEPVLLWPWIGQLLARLDEPPPKAPAVPRKIAASAGWLCETLWRALDLDGEPWLTRYVVFKMSTHQWYDMGPARRDLGYTPHVSMAEGLERLLDHELGT